MALVSLALPILLGGSPATAQTTPPDTSQSNTIADLQARLAQAREERQQAQITFEEVRAESDKAAADYAVATAAYDQAQAAFEALKNDPDRDQVAFQQARETRNTARETMLAARETRNAARTVLTAAREARNAAATQVQTLQAELAAAQEAEEQAPVLVLESQIEELTKQVSDLTAQAETAAKEVVDAEQRVTEAEQRATDAEQQVTDAEQETAKAEEQVADLEMNLYEVAKGCYLDDFDISGAEKYRTETDRLMCLSQDLIAIDTCVPGYVNNLHRNKIFYSLSIDSGGSVLLAPLSSIFGEAKGGILYRWDRGGEIKSITFRTGIFSHLVDVDHRSRPEEEVNLDEGAASQFAIDLRTLKDRVEAIVSGEITENSIPVCE